MASHVKMNALKVHLPRSRHINPVLMYATGQKKNGKGGCCPAGMEMNQPGTKCECPSGKAAKPGGVGCDDRSEEDRARQGNCPEGQILDPKEGQKSDTKDPKCQIDDGKNCKKPNIPATRLEGQELDSNHVVDCGKPKDAKERPKCDSRTHYTYVWVDSDGTALEECQKTKQFSQRKKSKVQELRGKFKDKWTKSKSQRDKQEKERQEKLKSLKEQRKKLQSEADEREKALKEKDDKKKARMGKCATVTALMMGLAENLAQKREEEHPYDWTSDYFDEDFITSDDRLNDFPRDIDIDNIACNKDNCTDIDAEAWMKEWQERAQARDLKENWPTCTQIRKRRLFARCPAKRSLQVDDVTSENVSSTEASSVPELASSKALVHCNGKHSTCTTGLEKRNPLIGILIEIGMFGARLGVSLLTRAATSIARWAPRLADIAKNTDRLFKIAQNGKAGARSVDSMKEAFSKIAKNPNFRKCLKD